VIGEDNGSFFIPFFNVWLFTFFNKKSVSIFPLEGRITSPSASDKLVGENNKTPSSFHQWYGAIRSEWGVLVVRLSSGALPRRAAYRN
jgi:hypothetical protein